MSSPLNSLAVFLRGVNVGGITIKMADLRGALAELPLTRIRTILASGNVVCQAGIPATEVKSLVEDKLRAAFGYDAWVIVMTTERVAELAAACPYPADDPQVHAYITLGSDPLTLEELSAATAGSEQLRLGPEAIAWPCPKGATLESEFSKVSSKARYKSSTTTRNLRTLLKIAAA